MSNRALGSIGILIGLVLSSACSSDDSTGDAQDGRDAPIDARDGADGDADARDDARTDGDVTEVCNPGEVICSGAGAETCNATGTGWEPAVACADPTPACTEGIGCTVCAGGEGTCDAGTARLCMPDGSGWYADDPCDAGAGEVCAGGFCTDMSGSCEEARLNNSYEGCDYFVTVSVNSTLQNPDVFQFAIVVGNRSAVEANVQVFDSGGEIANAVVPSNDALSINLPWKPALRQPIGSRIVNGGAFRVRSDVPVTVYQFNPLKYWTEDTAPPMYYHGSYSADASLVLPRNVLSGRYIGVSRETFAKVSVSSEGVESPSKAPAFLAIVGTRDNTTVTVTFSANTQGLGIPAHAPGDTADYTLNRFDVLQILTELPTDCAGSNWGPDPGDISSQVHYCEVPSEYDLTGTTVHADKPVAVFGGNDCSFVPYDRWACDHLEEQLFPVEAWGKRYIAARAQPIADEGNLWRVISAVDGNALTFTPPAAHPPATLDRNEWLEFETGADFLVSGSGPLLLVQFLPGQGSDLDSIGDPSMGLAVPVEQYRSEYNFLAPEDYQDVAGTDQQGHSYVNLIAPTGTSTWLDGTEITDFSAIGDTGYGVARVEIFGGSHSVTGTEKVGIMCYGYGNYASYLYPGGMNVDPINTEIIF